MAFALDCRLDGMEVRGIETGTSKKGNTFKSLRLEDSKGRSVEVSCTDDKFFSDIDSLKRGDIVNLDVVAVATYKGNSFVTLSKVPEIVGNAYGTDY